MKLSEKPRLLLIADPDFCNPYPNPLQGIPVAMEKMGLEFKTLNPATVPFETFKKEIETFRPELIFGLIQLKAHVTRIAQFLDQHHPVPVVNWNLEDPNGVVSPKDELSMIDLSAGYDLWCGIDKKMLPFWKTQAAFIPQAFDESIFYDQGLSRCYDVSFVGQLGHGEITKMYWPYMTELSKYGKKALLCTDRPMGIPLLPRKFEKMLRSRKHRNFLQKLPIWKCLWKNPKDEQEKAVFINQSKIHFGISRLHGDWEEKLKQTLPNYPLESNGIFYQIKARMFQAVGAGALALNDYMPELEELFDVGKEIVTFEFGNIMEMREKLSWCLKHESEGAKIARAGYERAHREHTYTARVGQILQKVRELL